MVAQLESYTAAALTNVIPLGLLLVGSVEPPILVRTALRALAIRTEGQLTVFLGPLAGWKPPAQTRSVARVRDSESMQRAVWRKNPDTFYVAIEKKAVLWVKSATEKTGNSRFRYSVPKGQSALSDLKWLKMTANGAVYCT